MSFEPFNFNEALLTAIEQAKFTKASKIQQLAIPSILDGNDILASAHSGSGKSASFVLPLIQRLLEQPRDISPAESSGNEFEPEETDSEETSEKQTYTPGPRVLVLTPTRELANQVSACIRRFTRELNLRYGILVGGAPYPPQVRMLKKPIDFLVATPGRLLDHINNGRVNFNDVEYLVIDELNRMLDMNMEADVEQIISQLPRKNEATGKKLQTLIFSDTLEGDNISAFSNKHQQDAVRFELAKSKHNYRALQQSMYIADEGDHKFKLIQAIIENSESKHIVIYSHSNESLENTKQFLSSHIENCSSDETGLNLGNSQQQIFFVNDQNIESQSLPEVKDIQIIHFDLPDDILVYLQRLEIAVDQNSEQDLSLLVGKDEWSMLHQVERYLGKTLSRKKFAGLEPESTEPSVSSKLSSGSRNNTQTKNRNPYSGRRQANNNQNPKNKRNGKSKNPRNNNTKNNNNKNGQNKNKQNRSQQPADNSNQFFGDSYMDDRDLHWKQYISNISNGNGNTTNKSANRKYRKRQGAQNNGFDLNNSPMAISAKTVRDRNTNNDWAEETSNKKPDVQIRVKGQNKSKSVDQEKLNELDNDRIEGKLGIHK